MEVSLLTQLAINISFPWKFSSALRMNPAYPTTRCVIIANVPMHCTINEGVGAWEISHWDSWMCWLEIAHIISRGAYWMVLFLDAGFRGTARGAILSSVALIYLPIHIELPARPYRRGIVLYLFSGRSRAIGTCFLSSYWVSMRAPCHRKVVDLLPDPPQNAAPQSLPSWDARRPGLPWQIYTVDRTRIQASACMQLPTIQGHSGWTLTRPILLQVPMSIGTPYPPETQLPPWPHPAWRKPLKYKILPSLFTNTHRLALRWKKHPRNDPLFEVATDPSGAFVGWLPTTIVVAWRHARYSSSELLQEASGSVVHV